MKWDNLSLDRSWTWPRNVQSRVQGLHRNGHTVYTRDGESLKEKYIVRRLGLTDPIAPIPGGGAVRPTILAPIAIFSLARTRLWNTAGTLLITNSQSLDTWLHLHKVRLGIVLGPEDGIIINLSMPTSPRPTWKQVPRLLAPTLSRWVWGPE